MRYGVMLLLFILIQSQKYKKRCVRIITYSDYLSSSEPIFQTLNILNSRKLVVQRISLPMFKIYKSDVPKPINILFRKNNTYHSYNTRRSDNLHTPVGRTEAIYKTFSFHGVYMCSILTKWSTCRKNKKLRFFLILIERVMTNMF